MRSNFASLSARQGELFRDTFVANLMASFTDRARADELARFAPVHETEAGRILAERARQSILADFVALAEREFPVVADWVRRRNDTPLEGRQLRNHERKRRSRLRNPPRWGAPAI